MNHLILSKNNMEILDIIFKNIRNNLLCGGIMTASFMVIIYPKKLSIFGEHVATTTFLCILVLAALLVMLNIFSFMQEIANKCIGSTLKKVTIWFIITLPMVTLNIILLGSIIIQFKQKIMPEGI
jgi:uncharacterized membrane protein YidH (DUF202 family)